MPCGPQRMNTHVHTYIHVQLQVVSHNHLHTSEEACEASFLTMTLVKGGGSSLTKCSWVALFLVWSCPQSPRYTCTPPIDGSPFSTNSLFIF